ncbi:MAG: glycerate kinase [Clostridia bacterium]|nr:glycerate kinase [Clostridia bacterium]
MRVLIAMDSFKGSLTSFEAADAVEKGLKRVFKNASVEKVAVADGGEGTVDALVQSLDGEFVSIEVSDPLGNKVQARYGIVNGDTAVIEMAEASGLCLIPESKRNPLITSTFGTGELIADALKRGCTKVIMGIGGSATNDGGMGMAKALGVKFYDADGNDVGHGGGALGRLVRIDVSGMNTEVGKAEFLAACDVNNPLYGNTGASKIFAPQKGATDEMVEILDRNLCHYASIVKNCLGIDLEEVPGAGAAGGLGAGLMVFCKAKLVKGIDLVLDLLKIDEKIKMADIVITGEGRIDSQTAYGKLPVGIAKVAKKYNKPVFAIAGFIGEGAELVYESGIDSILSSMTGPMSLEQSMQNSKRLIADASERLFRIVYTLRV